MSATWQRLFSKTTARMGLFLLIGLLASSMLLVKEDMVQAENLTEGSEFTEAALIDGNPYGCVGVTQNPHVSEHWPGAGYINSKAGIKCDTDPVAWSGRITITLRSIMAGGGQPRK
jgi:hypothetical protein